VGRDKAVVFDLRGNGICRYDPIADRLGFGGAIGADIVQAWGGGSSKGTVSKKASGALDWTVADVIALEDASEQFPITQMMVKRLDARDVITDICLMSLTGVIAKENGEAISAILAAEQSSSADDRVCAMKEIDEAIVALQQARARLAGRAE
jgi:hypothetical protein